MTKPVLEATLSRKSTLLKRKQSSYYVLSPAGFLLEYKDNDPVLHPDPTLSLKLADCDIGNPPSRSGKAGFTLRGKDAGKAIGRTHEYIFRTDSTEQAEQWWNAVSKFCGGAPRNNGGMTDSEAEDESVKSPVSQKSTMSQQSPVAMPGQAVRQDTAPQTQVQGEVGQQPVTAAPTTTQAPVAETTAGSAPETGTAPPTTTT